jgi:hypothetical protein
MPPAQIPAGVIHAPGSHLGWLTTNPTSSFAYTVEPLGHVYPAQCPVRVLYAKRPLCRPTALVRGLSLFSESRRKVVSRSESFRFRASSGTSKKSGMRSSRYVPPTDWCAYICTTLPRTNATGSARTFDPSTAMSTLLIDVRWSHHWGATSVEPSLKLQAKQTACSRPTSKFRMK